MGDPMVGDLVVDGVPVGPVAVLDTPRARAHGLLGRDGVRGAVLLRPAGWVHSLGMRFAIDVAFVDRRGRVLRTVTMVPGRMGRPVLRSRSVIEAEAGAFARWGLVPGSVVGTDTDGPGPPGR